MIPKAPCLGCVDKSLRCHSVCPQYLGYRRAMDSYNAGVAKSKATVGYEIEKLIKISRHR